MKKFIFVKYFLFIISLFLLFILYQYFSAMHNNEYGGGAEPVYLYVSLLLLIGISIFLAFTLFNKHISKYITIPLLFLLFFGIGYLIFNLNTTLQYTDYEINFKINLLLKTLEYNYVEIRLLNESFLYLLLILVLTVILGGLILITIIYLFINKNKIYLNIIRIFLGALVVYFLYINFQIKDYLYLSYIGYTVYFYFYSLCILSLFLIIFISIKNSNKYLCVLLLLFLIFNTSYLFYKLLNTNCVQSLIYIPTFKVKCLFFTLTDYNLTCSTRILKNHPYPILYYYIPGSLLFFNILYILEKKLINIQRFR